MESIAKRRLETVLDLMSAPTMSTTTLTDSGVRNATQAVRNVRQDLRTNVRNARSGDILSTSSKTSNMDNAKRRKDSSSPNMVISKSALRLARSVADLSRHSAKNAAAMKDSSGTP
jgi:hypothetical protein